MKPPAVLIVQQSHVANTAGGGSSNSGWQKRPLNTQIANTISGATFNAGTSVMSLPAGSYRASGNQAFYESGKISARLRDTTNSVSLVVGTRGQAPTGQLGSALMEGSFVLSGTANVEFQYSCGSSKATDGLGQAQNNGDVEIYSALVIEKIG